MKNQKGFTLLEIMVVLAVGAMLLAAMAQAFQVYGDNVANRAVADQQRKIRDAAMQYIQDNAGTIVAGAGPTTPYAISVQNLIDAGYLPSGFTAANAYSLATSIRVIEPTPGKLQGWVVASRAPAAAKVSGQNLRKIAQLIGADGGFAEAAGAGVTARGAYGGWSANMDPIGGSPSDSVVATALFVTEASGTAGNGDPLMRTSTAGQPELNTMETDINMGGHNIENAGIVQGTLTHKSGYLTLNSYDVASYGTGAAQLWYNANSNTITGWRQGGGGAGVNLSAAGATLTSANISGETYMGGSLSVWDVNARGGVNSSHHVNAATTMSAPEHYASGWFRTTGDSGWYSEKWCGGWHMSDATWIRTYCGKNVYVNAEMRANRITTEARISAGEYFDVNGWGARNGGCAKHGLIAQDGNGLLFCRGGVWVGTGGPTGGSYQFLGTFGSTYTGYNTSAYNSLVVVSATSNSCGRNGYSVLLYVNGGWLGSMHEGHPDYAKVGHTSFFVPAGGNFTITPQWTGSCNTKFDVWQYIQA